MNYCWQVFFSFIFEPSSCLILIRFQKKKFPKKKIISCLYNTKKMERFFFFLKLFSNFLKKIESSHNSVPKTMTFSNNPTNYAIIRSHRANIAVDHLKLVCFFFRWCDSKHRCSRLKTLSRTFSVEIQWSNNSFKSNLLNQILEFWLNDCLSSRKQNQSKQ